MPINAALASYAELNKSNEAPGLYEGREVGFSTLWNNEITYRFLDDVLRELAAHGKRMEAMEINFYKSPEVDWKK